MCSSGSRSDIRFVAVVAYLANPAARLGRSFAFVVGITADSRRQDLESDPLVVNLGLRFRKLRAVALRTLTTVPAGATIIAFAAIAPAAALGTLVAFRSLASVVRLLLLLLVVGRVGHLLVALILVRGIVALGALFVEARAILAQHTEIMIGELQVIFGLHAIAGELGVARHVLVFLKQLRRVSALAIVLPIAPEIRVSLAPAAAAAATLSIVDQMPTSLN
jgi:hypothetical protein